jgi:hypothetical protein
LSRNATLMMRESAPLSAPSEAPVEDAIRDLDTMSGTACPNARARAITKASGSA